MQFCTSASANSNWSAELGPGSKYYICYMLSAFYIWQEGVAHDAVGHWMLKPLSPRSKNNSRWFDLVRSRSAAKLRKKGLLSVVRPCQCDACLDAFPACNHGLDWIFPGYAPDPMQNEEAASCLPHDFPRNRWRNRFERSHPSAPSYVEGLFRTCPNPRPERLKRPPTQRAVFRLRPSLELRLEPQGT